LKLIRQLPDREGGNNAVAAAIDDRYGITVLIKYVDQIVDGVQFKSPEPISHGDGGNEQIGSRIDYSNVVTVPICHVGPLGSGIYSNPSGVIAYAYGGGSKYAVIVSIDPGLVGLGSYFHCKYHGRRQAVLYDGDIVGTGIWDEEAVGVGVQADPCRFGPYSQV